MITADSRHGRGFRVLPLRGNGWGNTGTNLALRLLLTETVINGEVLTPSEAAQLSTQTTSFFGWR